MRYVALFVLLAGCESPTEPVRIPEPLVAAVAFDGALRAVPDDSLWMTGYPVQSLDDYVQDSAGVPLFERDGRPHYHPVHMIQAGLRMLDSYHQTGETEYLRRAQAMADRLLLEADTIGGALYFPYTFDFALHSNPSHLLPAPWYSGMAQGEALMLLSRLYRETGNGRLLDAMQRVLPSLARFDAPAVVHVNANGHFWIDEYVAHGEGTLALNGFIFALYGVYEYYALTGDALAERILRTALATLRAQGGDYRDPGHVSRYCLIHDVRSLPYHRIHVKQFHDLYRMSGDTFFASLSDSLEADAY